MPEYATLDEVKNYIGIPTDMTQFDNKLNILLDAVNDEVAKDTGETTPNNQLKLGVCLWIEKQNTQLAGAKIQSDGDYRISFNHDEVPVEAAHFIRPFATNEYKQKYNTKGHKSAEIVAG